MPPKLNCPYIPIASVPRSFSKPLRSRQQNMTVEALHVNTATSYRDATMKYVSSQRICSILCHASPGICASFLLSKTRPATRLACGGIIQTAMHFMPTKCLMISPTICPDSCVFCICPRQLRFLCRSTCVRYEFMSTIQVRASCSYFNGSFQPKPSYRISIMHVVMLVIASKRSRTVEFMPLKHVRSPAVLAILPSKCTVS